MHTVRRKGQQNELLDVMVTAFGWGATKSAASVGKWWKSTSDVALSVLNSLMLLLSLQVSELPFFRVHGYFSGVASSLSSTSSLSSAPGKIPLPPFSQLAPIILSICMYSREWVCCRVLRMSSFTSAMIVSRCASEGHALWLVQARPNNFIYLHVLTWVSL